MVIRMDRLHQPAMTSIVLAVNEDKIMPIDSDLKVKNGQVQCPKLDQKTDYDLCVMCGVYIRKIFDRDRTYVRCGNVETPTRIFPTSPEKKRVYKQAIREGNHTCKDIFNWLTEHGYKVKSVRVVQQYIRQDMKGIRVDKNAKANKYYLE